MASDLLLRIGADLRGLNRQLDQAEKSLRRFSFKAERIGRDLTTRLTLPIVGVGGAAVSTFARFDKLEKGLSAVSGSAQEGARQMSSLLDVVKDTRTTLDLQTAATASLQLQAVGRSAESTENTLRQLAIAATVSGAAADDVGEVGRQLAQAAAKGNILQQELRIILERIPALAGIISQEFGTVTAEGLRAAGVSADEFIDRLTTAIQENERFQNVQGGLAKAIETFGIELQIAGKELGATIAETLNLEEALAALSNAISSAVQGFKNLNPFTQKAIVFTAGFLAVIGPVSLALGAAARSVSLLRSGFGLLLSPVVSVGTGLATVVTRLSGYTNLIVRGGAIGRTIALSKATQALGVAVRFATGPVGLIIGAVTGLVVVFRDAYNNSEEFREIVDGVASAFGRLFGAIKGLVNTGLKFLAKALDGIVVLLDNVRAFAVGVIAAIVELGKQALALFKSVGNTAASAIPQLAAIQEEIGVVAGEGLPSLSSALSSIGNAFSTAFNNTRDNIRDSRTEIEEITDATEDLAQAANNLGGSGSGSGRSAFQVERPDFSTSSLSSLNPINQELEQFSIGLLKSRAEAERLEAVFGSLDERIGQITTTFDAYRNGLAIIDDQSVVFGASFDALGEKINLTRGLINQLLEEGTGPYTDEIRILKAELESLTAQQDAYTLATEETAQRQAAIAKSVGSAIDALSSIFDQLAQGSISFAQAATRAIRQVIGALIQQGIAALVANTFKGPTGLLGPLAIPAAAAAGAAANALFQGLLSAVGVPALAEGGIVTGPTLALIGEGRENEVVLPLSRLNEFMGSSNVQVTGILRGSGGDLLAVIQSAERQQNRFA